MNSLSTKNIPWECINRRTRENFRNRNTYYPNKRAHIGPNANRSILHSTCLKGSSQELSFDGNCSCIHFGCPRVSVSSVYVRAKIRWNAHHLDFRAQRGSDDGFLWGWVFVKKDFFVKAGCLAGGDISDDIYMLVIVESGTVHEEQSRKDGTV